MCTTDATGPVPVKYRTEPTGPGNASPVNRAQGVGSSTTPVALVRRSRTRADRAAGGVGPVPADGGADRAVGGTAATSGAVEGVEGTGEVGAVGGTVGKIGGVGEVGGV